MVRTHAIKTREYIQAMNPVLLFRSEKNLRKDTEKRTAPCSQRPFYRHRFSLVCLVFSCVSGKNIIFCNIPYWVLTFFCFHGRIKNSKLLLGKTSFGYPAEQRVAPPVFFWCEIHSRIKSTNRRNVPEKGIMQPDSGYQRSWERTTLAVLGSGVQVPYTPPEPSAKRNFPFRSGMIQTTEYKIQGYSSAGRAAVSKTACRGFDSFCPCQSKSPLKSAYYGIPGGFCYR